MNSSFKLQYTPEVGVVGGVVIILVSAASEVTLQ
jgi:hypothetical protein